MQDFLFALVGGVMIGLAAVMLMATQGKILGVSGILSQLLSKFTEGELWRLSFVSGVLAAPVLTLIVTGYKPAVEITDSTALLILAGLLVGVGTTLGSGCTSGHGVCGLSRFSVRSIFATVVFMVVAIVTVWAMNSMTGA